MVELTTRAYATAMRYVQGREEYKNLEVYTGAFGKRVMFLVDEMLFDRFAGLITEVYEGTESCCFLEKMQGDCTEETAEHFVARAREYGADVLVALGGGKVLDLSKLVAYMAGTKLIVCPTAASSDAGPTAVSVMYSADGRFQGVHPYYFHPDMVLIDTATVAGAPIRLTRAGLGDAMATYYESLAMERSDQTNYVDCRYRRTLCAMAIAKAAGDTLFEKAGLALLAMEQGLCNEYVEDVIEANILLSGIGGENCGDGAPHRLYYALTAVPEVHKYMHGEIVAFGLVFQLVLEKADQSEIDKLLSWLCQVKLPCTLGQLGLDSTDRKTLEMVSEIAAENIAGFGESFYIDKHSIYEAICMADTLGRRYLAQTEGCR